MRRTFAVGLLLVLLAIFSFMISGFFGALVFAGAAALMFYPVQKWLEGYVNPKAAAGINHAQLGRQYIKSTRPVTGQTEHFVDKMPLNFLYAGILHAALPKVLH